MSLLRAIFCGERIEFPEEVRKELIMGEQVLHSVQQARLEQPISPDAIIITTERVMFRGPRWFGLWAKNRDFRYEDMGNVTVRKGIFSSSIHIKMRLMTYDLCLAGIPNGEAPLIGRTIQEGIDGRFQRIGEGSYALMGVQQPPSAPAAGQRRASDEDLLKILKYRYIKGEITKEEYEKMRKDIS